MDFDTDSLFRVVDVSGVIANALLGGVAARAARFDLIGFLLLAVVTGLGGGMIRDVLLGHGFPVMLTDRAYLAGALTAAAVAFFIDLSGRWTNRALLLIDFFGMGCWTATGVTKALTLGLDWLPAIAMGVITAVGGGMIRDVLLGQVPSIFGGSVLYATIAITSSTLAAAIIIVFEMPAVAMPACILLCPVFGVLSRWRRWTLPEPRAFSVPRPQLSWARPRTLRRIVGMGWVPGEPVTGQFPAQQGPVDLPGDPAGEGESTGLNATGQFLVPDSTYWPATGEFPAVSDATPTEAFADQSAFDQEDPADTTARTHPWIDAEDPADDEPR